MRFPMAGDLDGRKQQSAYSTQNLPKGASQHTSVHTENTPALLFTILPANEPLP